MIQDYIVIINIMTVANVVEYAFQPCSLYLLKCYTDLLKDLLNNIAS